MIEISGIFRRDRFNWTDPNYNYIGSKNIGYFIVDRIQEIPDGALVKLSFEVLDPHPNKND